MNRSLYTPILLGFLTACGGTESPNPEQPGIGVNPIPSLAPVPSASPIPSASPAPSLPPVATLPTTPCNDGSCLEDDLFTNQQEDLLLNDFSFRKRLIQENMIPYLDLDDPRVIDYIREPTTSYNNASAKGNDQASTKKEDLVRWYRDIRHGIADNPFREFDGGAIFKHPPVFASQAPFNTADHDVGVYKREFLENRLDFYNFFRALYGAQRSYISNYKQTTTQAGAWLGRQVVPEGGSGHYPSWTIANEKYGIKKATFEAGYHSRSSANIQVGGTGGDQSNLNHFMSNERLSAIWNEGEWDSMAALGHRHVFLDESSKDIGFGVYNWSLVWTVWGSNPEKNWGWNSLTEKAYYTKYPAATAQQGVEMWHSHGYYPFFATSWTNQSINAKLLPAYITPLTPGEQVKLKIELFHSQKDGDLSVGSPILGAPVLGFELSDIQGTGADQGGESPVGASVSGGKDWVGALPTHPFGGRWHFTAPKANQLQFRMPEKMWQTITDGFNKAAPEQKNYYTVRYTFTTNGNGLKIVKPFYMNQTIGAQLILQTTYFDMSRE
ncbi:hypothetical protein [Deefgea piscis]|uniref:hypothetical protein n=1 Tax=Deefgea piscis TaxID=2739061 RepID=UPI001C82049B|nr:hypothetical protein [Deefgea piscis]QZA81058.1 hypothetical protein K4H25_16550 [Deefgea piscis]